MIDYTLPLDQLPDPLPIEPLPGAFDVTITPPGSKSITCRAYVLAALADPRNGPSKIIRPLRADDTDTLLDALCTLGAKARWDGEDVFITGVGGRFPRGGELHMGDGGAPTRFMIACACLAAEPVTIDASPRMRERPIAEGVAMLRALGAKIEYVEEEGRLPVRVSPSADFRGGTLKVGKTASSQFISAVMLIAPWLQRGVILDIEDVTSPAYLDLSSACLVDFGVKVHEPMLAKLGLTRRGQITIPSTVVSAHEVSIEADASSALYWVLAAMLCSRSKYRVERIGYSSRQPDCDAMEGLAYQMGGNVDFLDAWDHGLPLDEGYAFGPKRLSATSAFNCDCSDIPDGSVAYAVGAATCAKPSHLTGLHTLRHKETDRLAALAAELTKVGCEVETGEDWIRITPMAMVQQKQNHAGSDDRREEDPDQDVNTRRSGSSSADSVRPGVASNPVVIETYNDHRMAMAFAVLGLARPGISIRNPACVAKSYPTFWKDFAKLYARP